MRVREEDEAVRTWLEMILVHPVYSSIVLIHCDNHTPEKVVFSQISHENEKSIQGEAMDIHSQWYSTDSVSAGKFASISKVIQESHQRSRIGRFSGFGGFC